ncbi:glycosyltransferase family 4 protein, partial [Rubrimonas sp.]|uniref:glycosyltransferase family 4 protein n=1 Tax=Rubrimonas sp. TaxID=2036015 RepID=UPI002FDCCC4E
MSRVADRPINIRFVHTRFPHWGGRSGYVRLVEALDPTRFRTHLHGASDSDADFPAWLAPVRPALRRMIAGRGMPWYKLSDFAAEARAFLDCLRGGADIVHFLDGEHAPMFLPGALRRAGLRGRRVVASFHQPPDLLRTIVSPNVVRRLDGIMLVSPSQQALVESWARADRMRVLLHGVDDGFFHVRSGPREDGPLRCVTVGHWLRDWNLFAAVAAALPALRFDVVTGSAVSELSNVRVHSGLSDEALAALYRQADILFLPLTESTANNALLEGMASGLPIVSTDLAGVRAYVGDCGAFLAPPGGVA